MLGEKVGTFTGTLLVSTRIAWIPENGTLQMQKQPAKN